MLRRLFEPRNIHTQALVPQVATYVVLLIWALVVIIPLYWALVTSLKLPGDVDNGPFYIPFVDFTPSLHAWHFMLVETGRDTLRPYVNSIVVALSSTFLAVLIGSLAAYALVRIRFRVKLAGVACFIVLLAAVIVAVHGFGVRWPVAGAVAIALFLLFLGTVARRTRRAVGNNDIEFWIISNRIMPPIVAVLPIYIMFQQLQLLDTWTALIATYTAVNLPIVVWLTRDFFAGIPLDLEESARDRRRLEAPRLLHHRAAAGALRPRRHLHARPHPRLERVSARPLPLQRQGADHAGAGLGAEHHARTAVVVHVGAHRHHDRAGGRHRRGAPEAHRPRHPGRGGQGIERHCLTGSRLCAGESMGHRSRQPPRHGASARLGGSPHRRQWSGRPIRVKKGPPIQSDPAA